MARFGFPYPYKVGKRVLKALSFRLSHVLHLSRIRVLSVAYLCHCAIQEYSLVVLLSGFLSDSADWLRPVSWGTCVPERVWVISTARL